ncbi:MAG: hypothetical protein JWR83_184 [Aeromicrobium sp.]|nr:hypothetical protein [Aeromicrobium sp.]
MTLSTLRSLRRSGTSAQRSSLIPNLERLSVHLSSKRVRLVAIAATSLGCVMLLVAGFMIWNGNSSNSTNGVDGNALAPYQGNTNDFENLRPTQAPASGVSLPGFTTGASAGDPFANSVGDSSIHRVTISVTSDGAIYVGYRYRNGKKGVKVANGSFSDSRTLHGPLPLAQVGVQVIGNGTYAICSVTIDGAKVVTYTAKGAGHVVVCTG